MVASLSWSELKLVGSLAEVSLSLAQLSPNVLGIFIIGIFDFKENSQVFEANVLFQHKQICKPCICFNTSINMIFITLQQSCMQNIWKTSWG